MPTAEQNEADIRTFVERVLNQGDIAYAEGLFADGFVEHNPLSPDMGNGRDAAIASLLALRQLSSDLRFEILDVVATEDRVGVRSRATGTDDGPGWGAPMGAPATGRSFSVEAIDVVAVGPDGRHTEHYGIVDVPGMLTQLGLMPSGPPPA